MSKFCIRRLEVEEYAMPKIGPGSLSMRARSHTRGARRDASGVRGISRVSDYGLSV